MGGGGSDQSVSYRLVSYKKLTGTFLTKLSVFFLLVTGVSKQELLFSLRTFQLPSAVECFFRGFLSTARELTSYQ